MKATYKGYPMFIRKNSVRNPVLCAKCKSFLDGLYVQKTTKHNNVYLCVDCIQPSKTRRPRKRKPKKEKKTSRGYKVMTRRQRTHSPVRCADCDNKLKKGDEYCRVGRNEVCIYCVENYPPK